MRVLLVGPDLESNLSLRYLSAALKAAGHDPSIATFDSAEDAPAVLRQAAGAGLVGLSLCFQIRAPEFLALARALKVHEPLRPIIAGGHYASCAAADLLAHHPELDLIVIHEGEQAIVEVANLGATLAGAERLRGVALRVGGQPHLTAPRPILDDLDQLPLADRSGPARLLAGVPTAYLMGSRGCVNSCDYCCITTLHRLAPGRRFRQRAPEAVAHEMALLYHQHGVRQFVFHDDNFLVPSYAHNVARIEGFERALARHGVKDFALVLKCSPRDADRRILARLKQLGLIRIFMGIESGTQCGLDAIGRRQTVDESHAALAVCEGLGISSQYTLITFHPEATPQSMLADLDFVGRHPAHPLNYCRAEIYAGTPLEQRLLAQGRIEGDYLGRAYRYTDPRVTRIWEVGRDLFAGRCWGKDEVLGQAIRLDHQLTVVGRFYEGAEVEALTRSFREWQVGLNLGTAALFRELVSAFAEEANPDVGGLLEDLTGRERASREVLQAQLCEFRAAVADCSRTAFPAEVRPAAPGGRRALSRIAPRHAAAVAVALGLTGCLRGTIADEGGGAPVVLQDAGVSKPAPSKQWHEEPGVAEAAPPPYKAHPAAVPKPAQPDAGAPAEPPASPPAQPQIEPKDYRIDHGVAEAAPPPYDRQRKWRDDVGLSEMAPAPIDAGQRRKPPPPPPPPPPPLDPVKPPHDWREDHGVAEAAPPPLDPERLLPQTPPVWHQVRATAEPEARITLNGVELARGKVSNSNRGPALSFVVAMPGEAPWTVSLLIRNKAVSEGISQYDGFIRNFITEMQNTLILKQWQGVNDAGNDIFKSSVFREYFKSGKFAYRSVVLPDTPYFLTKDKIVLDKFINKLDQYAVYLDWFKLNIERAQHQNKELDSLIRKEYQLE